MSKPIGAAKKSRTQQIISEEIQSVFSTLSGMADRLVEDCKRLPSRSEIATTQKLAEDAAREIARLSRIIDEIQKDMEKQRQHAQLGCPNFAASCKCPADGRLKALEDHVCKMDKLFEDRLDGIDIRLDVVDLTIATVAKKKKTGK